MNNDRETIVYFLRTIIKELKIAQFVCLGFIMRNVFYWRGVCGDTDLLTSYKPYIDRLLAGDYKGLSLEKLHGVKGLPIYSIRVDNDHEKRSKKSTRLLFTTYKGNIYLLSEVLNHKYKTNRFLKDPKILKAFLAKTGANLDIQIDEKLESSPFSADELKQELGASDDTPAGFVPLDYYKQQFITLNGRQNEALQTKLPAIIYGSAGSGKTLVALTMLQDYVSRHRDSLTRPVLYISQSPNLVDEMRKLWQETASPEMQDQVVFSTYEEFVKKQLPKGYSLATSETFKTWFTHAIQQPKYNKCTIPTLEEVWREFRIRSGYNTDKEYIELGIRKSTLSQEQRALICELYQNYLSELKAKRLVSLELSPWDEQEKYALVIADEAQDFAYGQLKKLFDLAYQGQLAYLLGDHQILFDGKSRLAYLREMFYSFNKDKKASEIELPGTYRCPQRVVSVANQLIALKYAVTGGKADDIETEMKVNEDAESKRGTVLWVGQSDEAALDALREKAKSRHVAVVTSPEYINEAKEKFKTGLVFTAEEIKGLEYKTIIVYRPLDNPDCERAAHLLKNQEEITLTPKNRPKAGQGDESFLPYFNRLVTAVTRTSDELIVVQDDRHSIKPISQPLREVFASEPQGEKTIPAVVIEASSAEEWEQEAQKLLRQGKETQARAIFIETLKRSDKEFHLFLQKHLPTSLTGNETLLMAKPVVIETKAGKYEEEEKKQPPKKKKQKASQKKEVNQEKQGSTSQEEQQVMNLLKDFSENRLTVLLKLFEPENILFKPMQLKEGPPISLLHYILGDKNKTTLFIRCMVNDLVLLKKVAEKVYAHLKKSNVNQIILGIFNTLAFVNQSLRGISSIEGYAPVHLAVAMENFDLLTVLFNGGADFKKASSKGSTPATIAASLETEEKCVAAFQKLHELGVDLREPDGKGFPPIFLVIQNGYLKAVEFLLASYENAAETVWITSKKFLNYVITGEKTKAILTKKIAQRISLGDKEDAIRLLPIDIAEVIGHQDIVDILKLKLSAQIVSSSMAFFKPENKGVIQNENKQVRSEDTQWDKKIIDFINDFSEKKLLDILNLVPVENLYKPIKTKSGPVLSLIHYIMRDTHKASLFISYLANDVVLLRKLAEPTSKFLFHYIHSSASSHKEAKFFAQLSDLEYVDMRLGTFNYAEGDAPIHILAQKGDMQALAILLKYPEEVDLNKTNTYGHTAAFYAAFYGHVNVLAELAKHKVNLQQPINNGANLIYAAMEGGGHIPVIDFLVKNGVDINHKDKKGIAPICIPCQTGQIDLLIKLAELGANVNTEDLKGFTPAHFAALEGRVDILAELHKQGADLSRSNIFLVTPLLWAAQENQVAVFDLFYSLGIDINQTNKFGETATHLAAPFNRVKVIEKIFKLNGNLDLPDSDGCTPLHQVVIYNDNVEFLKKLLQFGVNKNSQNNEGETPAFVAAKNGSTDALRTLQQAGADLNQTNHQGVTPLFIAAQLGNFEIIKVLLTNKEALEKPFTSSRDSLLKFCEGYDESIQERMLLTIDKRIQSGDSETAISILPVDIAEIMGHEAIVELLKSEMKKSPAYPASSFFNQRTATEYKGTLTPISPGGKIN